MINSRQFAARLNFIAKNDEAIMVALIEATSFALYHARVHGQKTPWGELTTAAESWRPWLRVPFTKWASKQKVGVRKGYTAEKAIEDASKAIEALFDEKARKAEAAAKRRAEKRAQAEQAGEGNQATPTPEKRATADSSHDDDVIDVEVREVHQIKGNNALIVNGQAWNVTPEEAAELAAVLATMRAGRSVEEVALELEVA